MSLKVDQQGRFGQFGGMFVSEILMHAVNELNAAYKQMKLDREFSNNLRLLLSEYAGRPTPLTFAKNLSEALGCRIYLKREDLLHTGAHKLNNALGQALLAKRMGKKRLLAETGAGQHGVAVATAAAKLGLDAEIYMGAVDMERQRPNVFRMELLGANVTPVDSGTATLKDAINEALRDWAGSSEDSHYLIGSVLGPHPFPDMVAYFQSVIGEEARKQMLDVERKLPDSVIACVGGGSNAIGIFKAFLNDRSVNLFGVEAGGSGIPGSGHAARFLHSEEGRPGVLHGCYTQVLQDRFGQIQATSSISAGLDYPAVGPEHAYLNAIGRVRYVTATDSEALCAFKQLSSLEGIILALESAHALAYLNQASKDFTPDQIVLINLSGRGDKDLFSIQDQLGGQHGAL